MKNSLPAIDVLSKLAYFQPGMYIVRLAEDAPGNVTMLSSTPVGRGTIDFFPGDGVLRNTLVKVGDCVVLRVKTAAASVLITEFHKHDQLHKTVLTIDKIGAEGGLHAVRDHSVVAVATATAAATAAATPAANQPSAKVVDQSNDQSTQAAIGIVVRKIAHIERLGDVASQTGWLGDPTSFSRLEGFAMSPAGLPDGVQLQYGVLVEGMQHYASAVSGQFVGTRQKAKAITGLVFDLTGPNAQNFRLSGHVAFAGLPPLAVEPGISMSGPSGTEHLVALQLAIAPNATQSTAASAWDDPKVTRITRKAPAPAQKATVKKAPVKKVVAQKAPLKKAVAKKGVTSRSKK